MPSGVPRQQLLAQVDDGFGRLATPAQQQQAVPMKKVSKKAEDEFKSGRYICSLERMKIWRSLKVAAEAITLGEVLGKGSFATAHKGTFAGEPCAVKVFVVLVVSRVPRRGLLCTQFDESLMSLSTRWYATELGERHSAARDHDHELFQPPGHCPPLCVECRSNVDADRDGARRG